MRVYVSHDLPICQGLAMTHSQSKSAQPMDPDLLGVLQKTASNASAMSMHDIQEKGLDEIRRFAEERHHKRPLAFKVGLGSIMRDRTMSHEDVEHVLDQALASL